MSICRRIIARIDVKGTRLIKGIQFEGLRVLGDAWETAKKYSFLGIDEIFYSDAVASLYGRNGLSEILKKTSEDSFIPITAGGGIRSIDDGKKLLANGADKLAINSEAVRNPFLINQLAETFGSQCVVVSIQARRSFDNKKWDVMIESGRERSNKNLFDWILDVQERGAGEIIITSVDQDGTCKGPDFDLIKEVDPLVAIPLVFGGGFSKLNQINDIFSNFKSPTGVAIGLALHNSSLKISDVKESLKNENITIRPRSNYFFDNKNRSKKIKISILDYGMGNVESLNNAFNYIGAEVSITSSKEEIEKADLLAIPGVGSFPEGMNNIKSRNLLSLIQERVKNKKAILGICLGMQLLFTLGEEYRITKGLNFIKGNVSKLLDKNLYGEHKILPHMGWNKITFLKDHEKYSFENKELIYQYFVHSFAPYVDIEDRDSILCQTEYEGQKFVSAVRKGNIFGFQFHPERSGNPGLILLSDIIDQIK
tara:strand:+ start:564 stop:2009 length:1446 start_codon:yes stop_codon:yes gene_type:complete